MMYIDLSVCISFLYVYLIECMVYVCFMSPHLFAYIYIYNYLLSVV